MVFPATILDLRVELLLGGTWTDISAYALQRDPVTISRGSPASSKPSGLPPPSTASLTLQNDGRFSPRNPAGPYYGQIGRNTQLRISVPDGSGGRKYRFWGEVPAWPPSWDVTGTDVYAQIQAAGILRRLGQGTAPPLDSPWKRGMLRLAGSAAPVAYWPCEDGTGAQSIASGLPGGTPMRVTGTPAYASDAGFPASQPIPLISKSTWTGVIPAHGADAANVLRFFLHVPAGGAVNQATIIRLHTAGGVEHADVFYDSTIPGIKAQAFDANGASIIATGALPAAGQKLLMSLELTQSGADVAMTLSSMTAAGVITSVTQTALTRTIGQGTRVVVDPATGVNPVDDTALGQISYQGTLVPLSSLATLLAAWAGETAGSRFARLCAEQGVPYVIKGSVADTEPMGVQTSLKFLDLLAECADADQGMIYEPRAGRPAGTGGTGAFLKLADFTGSYLTGQNANFDGGIGTWLGTGNSSVAGIGSPTQAGSGALQVTCTSAGNADAGNCAAANILTQGFACVPGDWVPCAAWFRATATPRTCVVGADFYNSAGTFLSTIMGADTITSSTSGYTFLASHVVAPANAARARIKVREQGCALNETYDVDTVGFGGPATLAQAIAQWQAASGRTMGVRREYYGASSFPGAVTADLLADQAAGRKVCLTLRPAYNPVSAADLAAMTTFLASCKAAGVVMDIALWHEPFYSGLSQAQFQAMIAYYGPAVRQYYPLVFVTANSAVLANGEGAYFTAGAFDKTATDYYAGGYVSGDRLDTTAAIADGASPPLPFGIWELNASTDAVSGQTQVQATNYFGYIKSFFDSRAAQGKANLNGDLLLFNADSNAAQETPLTYGGDYRMALWQAQVDDTAAAAASASLALGYRTRASLQSQAPALTLAYDQAQLSPPLQPTDDDQQTVNDVTVTRAYGGSSARAQVTTGPLSTAAPPAGAGPYQDTPGLNLASDSRTADFAGWLAHVGTTDELRYPSVGVDLARPQLAAVFYACQDLDIGDRLAVTGLPAWLPPGGISQLVQGMTETLFGYIFVIQFNGVPESPWQVGIVGDPVYAQVDTDGSTLHAGIGSGDTSMTVDTTAGSPTALWTTAGGGSVGAYLDLTAMGQPDVPSAETAWAGILGRPLTVRHVYFAVSQTSFTYNSDMQADAAAGRKICFAFKPSYNPVSATELAAITGFLAACKAGGLKADVTCWHEPFFGGLSSAQYIAMINYYGPAIRQYYPLVFVTSASSAQSNSENTFYPGDSAVDKVATDLYAGSYYTFGTRLDTAALTADNAVPPKPFGLWEFNSNPTGNFLSGQNAGFEGGTGNWTGSGNCTTTGTSAQAHGGTSSLQMSSGAAGNMTAAHCSVANVDTQGLRCAPGDQIFAFSWFRAQASPRTCQAGLQFYTSGKVLIGAAMYGTGITDSTTGWTQDAPPAFTAPATSAYCRESLQVAGTGGAAEIHYADDVIIYNATTLEFYVYLQSYFTGRLAAGKANADLMFFNNTGGGGLSTVITSASDYRVPALQAIFDALNRADLPFDILMGGERITVTVVTGAANPQAFTINRSVNGVVKAHTAGEPVTLFAGTYVSL